MTHGFDTKAAATQATTTRRFCLGWLAASCAMPATAWARGGSAERAPAIPLPREASPDVDPAGFLVSEKFDGVRAVWDGSTMRFRSGNTIALPAWFAAGLPTYALDGELWLGRGRFEQTVGAVRRTSGPHEAWRAMRYQVFELPGAGGTFAARAARLRELAEQQPSPSWRPVAQETFADRAALRRRLDDVVRGGGEGLVLHRADAPYETGRSDALLKLKPVQDAEAVVVAHLPGRGKYDGRLGALQVRTDRGVSFALGTGLSDAQRAAPPAIGTRVTYTYQGTTAAGVPRFASFLRVRDADV